MRLFASALALLVSFACVSAAEPKAPATDIVFRNAKVAVFVDGDFWHGWRLPAWEHKLTSFWLDKLHANRDRDRRNFRKLRSLGWRVVRVWQHQLKRDFNHCLSLVEDALGGGIG